MPRQPDGTYDLPLPDVVEGTVISSTWANTTMADIAATLTNCLDTEGSNTMTGPFPFADGTVAAPGITWGNEPSTGFYRASAGDMRVSVLGADLFRWSSSAGVQVWDGADWVAVALIGQSGTVPDGANPGDIPIWDGSKYVALPPDPSLSPYTPQANLYYEQYVVPIPDNIADTLDATDQALLDHQSHVESTTIHFADELTGAIMGRSNQVWVPVVADANAAVTPSVVFTDSPANGQVLVWNAVEQRYENGAPAGGVTDHDQLNAASLLNDDHPQYHNDARGDARYYQLGSTVDDSLEWDGRALIITDTDPGVYDPNTIYFIKN